MIKSEIIEKIAHKLDYRRPQVEEVVNEFCELLYECAKNGEEFSITGLFTVSSKQLDPKTVENNVVKYSKNARIGVKIKKGSRLNKLTRDVAQN
jgi:nucleoid DNA-binding protein